MEYDAEGHAGFLDRIFRAAVIRNKVTTKQECQLKIQLR